MRLNEQCVEQAEIVARLRTNVEMQKRQINELNRFVWLLIKRQGGQVDMTKNELDDFPTNWSLQINWSEEKQAVEFKAATKPVDKESQEV